MKIDCPNGVWCQIKGCPYHSTVVPFMPQNKQEGKPWEEKFIEEGARIEHERWAKWQKYLHSKLYPLGNSELSINNHLKVLPTELYTRWERQINTPYSELSEKEKESDRNEVRAYLPLLRQLELDTIARCAEAIDRKIKELDTDIKPLKEEYDHEYKLWFGSNIRNNKRKKLLEEYETGAKGNKLFSLSERKEALLDIATAITSLKECIPCDNGICSIHSTK